MGKLFTSPLTVKGELHDVCLFNLSLDPEEIRHQIPKPLELVIHKDRAWISTVSVHLHNMRPAFLPIKCGVNYHHLGYRVLVDCPTRWGKMRGIYFLESYCPSKSLAWLGNLATEYQFKPGDFREAHQQDRYDLSVWSGRQRLETCWELKPGAPTRDSCLEEVNEGLRLVGPLNQAFSVHERQRVTAVRISRESWPLEPVHCHYFKTNRFNSAVLEFAARVPEVIPYTWAKAEVVA